MAGTIVSIHGMLLDAPWSNEFQVPWDGRDQEEQSEILFNAPLRSKNRQLEDENMHLKRLLREHGIPWSDSVAGHHAFRSSTSNSTSGRRRSSRLSAVGQHRFPHLPVEVILRILHYALVADGPIIDPLSKLNTETLTSAEAKCGPQIAIGFLATCKAYHVDGKRILWYVASYTGSAPISNTSIQVQKQIRLHKPSSTTQVWRA